jgi:uncharacterized protein YeaO (DUF488 family)
VVRNISSTPFVGVPNWPGEKPSFSEGLASWLKDLAPSTKLRKWYGHDLARWPAFRQRYWTELKGQGDLLALLKQVTQDKTVTFVYAASDEEHNSALALQEFLERGQK